MDPVRLVCPHCDLDSVASADLAHNAAEVGLHRAETHVELVGDLRVGSAAGATVSITSSLRAVSGSIGGAGGSRVAEAEKVARRRAVMLGAIRFAAGPNKTLLGYGATLSQPPPSSGHEQPEAVRAGEGRKAQRERTLLARALEILTAAKTLVGSSA